MVTTVQIRLIPHEDGASLVLDQALLDKLNVGPEAVVSIQADDGTLLITPAEDEARRAALDAAIEEMHSQYGDVFRRLAKGVE